MVGGRKVHVSCPSRPGLPRRSAGPYRASPAPPRLPSTLRRAAPPSAAFRLTPAAPHSRACAPPSSPLAGGWHLLACGTGGCGRAKSRCLPPPELVAAAPATCEARQKSNVKMLWLLAALPLACARCQPCPRRSLPISQPAAAPRPLHRACSSPSPASRPAPGTAPAARQSSGETCSEKRWRPRGGCGSARPRSCSAQGSSRAGTPTSRSRAQTSGAGWACAAAVCCVCDGWVVGGWVRGRAGGLACCGWAHAQERWLARCPCPAPAPLTVQHHDVPQRQVALHQAPPPRLPPGPGAPPPRGQGQAGGWWIWRRCQQTAPNVRQSEATLQSAPLRTCMPD